MVHKVILTNLMKTYINVNKLNEEVTDYNITLPSKFDLEVKNGFKTLITMYWLPKIHKTPTGARFIDTSRKCSIKALSKTVTQKFLNQFLSKFFVKSHIFVLNRFRKR